MTATYRAAWACLVALSLAIAYFMGVNSVPPAIHTTVGIHHRALTPRVVRTPTPVATIITANPKPHRITEDDPRWNCLTMGNHRCGPRYADIDDTANPQVWVRQIRLDHPGYDPYRCLVDVGATTYIACQDGWVGSS